MTSISTKATTVATAEEAAIKEATTAPVEDAAQAKEAARVDDLEQTPGVTRQVSTYDKLLQDIADSPKSVHMGGGQSKCLIGRQKYIRNIEQVNRKQSRKQQIERNQLNRKQQTERGLLKCLIKSV